MLLLAPSDQNCLLLLALQIVRWMLIDTCIL